LSKKAKLKFNMKKNYFKILQMFFVLLVVFAGFSFFARSAEARTPAVPVITEPLAPITASNAAAYTFYATGDANEWLYFSVNDGQGTNLYFYDPLPTIDGTGHYSRTVDLSSLADSAVVTFSAYSVASDTSGASGSTSATTSKDVSVPTVVNVDAGIGGGTYRAGTVVPVRVHFSEVVYVTGTPQLGMRVSGANRLVDYTSGDGTDMLVFNYTVIDGDYTTPFHRLDYYGTDSLSGTIKDGVGNDAVLTLASPGYPGSLNYSTTINIDTIAPVVTTACISVTGASGAGDVFKKGDFATPTWDNGVACDNAGGTNNDIASVLFNAGDFQSTSSAMHGNGPFPGTGEYTAYTALDSQNDTLNNVTVTVTDTAGNVTTVTGTNDYVINTIAPTVTYLGDGSSVYSLPVMGPGYGADLVFSEELDSASKTAVENALTAGTDKTLGYTWSGNTLEIRANEMPTFTDNVFADLTNLIGNTSVHQLLIQSTPSHEVWVDDNYASSGTNDGHIWGFDAFNTIDNGVNAVAEGGTVNVLAGDYSFSSVSIIKPLTLSGDIGDAAAGPGGDAPTVSAIGGAYPIISVEAPNVTIQGIVFNGNGANQPSIVVMSSTSGATISDNEFYNNSGGNGIDLAANSSGNTVTNNNIHGSANGISLSGSTNNTISDNDIHDNTKGIDIGIGGLGENGGTVIENNNIHNNTYGVYFDAGNQGSTVTIGDGNTITDNGGGIYIDGDAGNFVIHGNSILNNHGFTSGLYVDNAQFVDAARNWWGDGGPNVNGDGPGAGPGNETITTVNSPLVFYRPFCTDAECGALSSVETDPTHITDHFTDGVFTIEGADYQHASTITVAEDLTISVNAGIGTSSVEIPAGTEITRVGGGLMNGGDLTAEDIAEGSLSGLGSGVTAEGALQWGISGLTLQFNPAITLHIFVGTALNGQLLQVKRSTDGITWTSDGIVPPANCVVSGGICTFQATEASTYVSTKSTSSGGGGGGGGGGNALALLTYPVTAQPTVVITTSTVNLLDRASIQKEIERLQALLQELLAQQNYLFTKNLKFGDVDPDVYRLQQYLNTHGFILATTGVGSAGNETNKFGALTQQALIKFQKAKNVSPAVGYFGPLTRSFINQ
jgi:parallel beta-helix repeat protein